MSRPSQLLLLFLLLFAVIPGAMAADPVKVQIQTNYGNIMLELYPDKAPLTVANFLRYVDSGFYENTIFHRVIPGFMVQGGGHDLDYKEKPALGPIPNEANNGLKNIRGTLAMARKPDPHSASSQFFINLVDNGFLDFTARDSRGWGYCVFGKVIEGMNVVDEIASVPTGPAGPFAQDAPQGLIVIDRMVRAPKIKKAPTPKQPSTPSPQEPSTNPESVNSPKEPV